AELVQVDLLGVQRHVGDDDRVHDVKTPADVGDRPDHRRRRQLPPNHHLVGVEPLPVYAHPRPRRHTIAFGDGDFDRFARRHVDAVQPGGGPTREGGGPGQSEPDRGQVQLRTAWKYRRCVLTGTDATPIGSLQLDPAQTGLTSVSNRERALLQFGWHTARHRTMLYRVRNARNTAHKEGHTPAIR